MLMRVHIRNSGHDHEFPTMELIFCVALCSIYQQAAQLTVQLQSNKII